MSRRNDPLYRVIDLPPLVDKIDGRLYSLVDRLTRISSLGLVAWLHRMAQYPKSEHRYGTVYQVARMMDAPWFKGRKKEHGDAMLLAACFLHVGHFAFTYAAERAFLRACRQKDEVKAFLYKVVRKVTNETPELRSAEDYVEEFTNLIHAERLYRWFSAYRLLDNKPGVASALQEVETDKNDYEAICTEAVQNLVNEESIGWKYLDYANRADYVQRDALYFGTARLDISHRHLYQRDFLNPPLATDEWSLVDQSLSYLRTHIYETTELRGQIALFERLLAHLMCMQNVEATWLLDWDDGHLRGLLEEGRAHGKQVIYAEAADRSRTFMNRQTEMQRGLTLRSVSHPARGSAELEERLVDRSGTGLFRYPYDDGFVIDAKPVTPQTLLPAGWSQFDVDFYLSQGEVAGRKLFACLHKTLPYSDLTYWLEAQEALGRILTGVEVCHIANGPVIEAVEKALRALWQRKRSAFDNLWNLLELKTLYRDLWANFENFTSLITCRQWLVERSEEPPGTIDQVFARMSRSILAFPGSTWRFKRPAAFIEELARSLWELYETEEDRGCKGNMFEAICLTERLKWGAQLAFWLYVNDLQLFEEADGQDTGAMQKTPTREFDLIEIYDGGGQLRIDVREASIDMSARKERAEKHKMNWFIDRASTAIPDATIGSYCLRADAGRQVNETCHHTKPPTARS